MRGVWIGYTLCTIGVAVSRLGGRLQRLRAKRKDQMRQHSYSKDTGLTMRMGLTIVLLALAWVFFMERPRRFEGR